LAVNFINLGSVKMAFISA